MKYESGQYYHAFNRGAHGLRIFRSKEHYAYLLRLLHRNARRYDITITAYCLMPNHYHLILRQNDGGLIGDFLRTTFNAFSQGMNRRLSHRGTHFQSQVKVKHLKTDRYCLQAVRYLHLNPVAAGLTRRPEEWPQSDYLRWIDPESAPVTAPSLREFFFPTPDSYRRFTEQAITEARLAAADHTGWPPDRL